MIPVVVEYAITNDNEIINYTTLNVCTLETEFKANLQNETVFRKYETSNDSFFYNLYLDPLCLVTTYSGMKSSTYATLSKSISYTSTLTTHIENIPSITPSAEVFDENFISNLVISKFNEKVESIAKSHGTDDEDYKLSINLEVKIIFDNNFNVAYKYVSFDKFSLQPVSEEEKPTLHTNINDIYDSLLFSGIYNTTATHGNAQEYLHRGFKVTVDNFLLPKLAIYNYYEEKSSDIAVHRIGESSSEYLWMAYEIGKCVLSTSSTDAHSAMYGFYNGTLVYIEFSDPYCNNCISSSTMAPYDGTNYMSTTTISRNTLTFGYAPATSVPSNEVVESDIYSSSEDYISDTFDIYRDIFSNYIVDGMSLSINLVKDERTIIDSGKKLISYQAPLVSAKLQSSTQTSSSWTDFLGSGTSYTKAEMNLFNNSVRLNQESLSKELFYNIRPSGDSICEKAYYVIRDPVSQIFKSDNDDKSIRQYFTLYQCIFSSTNAYIKYSYERNYLVKQTYSEAHCPERAFVGRETLVTYSSTTDYTADSASQTFSHTTWVCSPTDIPNEPEILLDSNYIKRLGYYNIALMANDYVTEYSQERYQLIAPFIGYMGYSGGDNKSGIVAYPVTNFVASAHSDLSVSSIYQNIRQIVENESIVGSYSRDISLGSGPYNEAGLSFVSKILNTTFLCYDHSVPISRQDIQSPIIVANISNSIVMCPLDICQMMLPSIDDDESGFYMVSQSDNLLQTVYYSDPVCSTPYKTATTTLTNDFTTFIGTVQSSSYGNDCLEQPLTNRKQIEEIPKSVWEPSVVYVNESFIDSVHSIVDKLSIITDGCFYGDGSLLYYYDYKGEIIYTETNVHNIYPWNEGPSYASLPTLMASMYTHSYLNGVFSVSIQNVDRLTYCYNIDVRTEVIATTTEESATTTESVFTTYTSDYLEVLSTATTITQTIDEEISVTETFEHSSTVIENVTETNLESLEVTVVDFETETVVSLQTLLVDITVESVTVIAEESATTTESLFTTYTSDYLEVLTTVAANIQTVEEDISVTITENHSISVTTFLTLPSTTIATIHNTLTETEIIFSVDTVIISFDTEVIPITEGISETVTESILTTYTSNMGFLAETTSTEIGTVHAISTMITTTQHTSRLVVNSIIPVIQSATYTEISTVIDYVTHQTTVDPDTNDGNTGVPVGVIVGVTSGIAGLVACGIGAYAIMRHVDTLQEATVSPSIKAFGQENPLYSPEKTTFYNDIYDSYE